jgi:TolB-like protein
MANKLFQELRRRRVLSTVALYIVGAWVVLQVAELAFPALDKPDEAIRWVWLGALLLLPLVLVFGWRYDIAKTGIQRTAPSAEQEAAPVLQTADLWFIGSLAAIALLTVGVMLIEIGQMEPDTPVRILPAENSIAVMPFDVCEERASDLPLASGLTGEVIERLAARDRLKVIGRSTVFNLASAGMSAQQVSELLGTEHVLTGTLCRDGLDLTLDAELVDQDGFIEWRERFTRLVNRFDQVEQQLATLVANGVSLELGDVIQASSNAPVNRLALEQLLIGEAYHREGNLDKAHEAYSRALEHEPGLAKAVWSLAMLETHRSSLLNVGPSIESAWPLGQQALELALQELERGVPDFEANRAAGSILNTMARWQEELTWREANELGEEEAVARIREAKEHFAEAEQYLRSALLLNPSDTSVRNLLAGSLSRQGIHRDAEALGILQDGLALDPFNKSYSVNLATKLAHRGQYRQAMELLDRFQALPLDSRPGYGFQLEIMNNSERFDEKLAKLIEIMRCCPEIAGTDHWVIAHMWWMAGQIAGLGLLEEAEAYYQAVAQLPYPENRSEWRDFFLGFYLEYSGRGAEYNESLSAEIAGMSNEEILDNWGEGVRQYAIMLWQTGERERAIELFETLQHRQQAPLWAERQTQEMTDLAELYLEVGRNEDARPLFEKSALRLEEQVEAGMRHPQTLYQLARVYAFLGDDAAAADLLDMAVDYGSLQLVLGPAVVTTYSDKTIDPFPDTPRFNQARNRMQNLMDQQAANVRDLLAHNDLDALLVPVFEYAAEELEQKDRGNE